MKTKLHCAGVVFFILFLNVSVLYAAQPLWTDESYHFDESSSNGYSSFENTPTGFTMSTGVSISDPSNYGDDIGLGHFNGYFTAQGNMLELAYTYDYSLLAESNGNEQNLVEVYNTLLLIDRTIGKTLHYQTITPYDYLYAGEYGDAEIESRTNSGSNILSYSLTPGHDMLLAIDMSSYGYTNGNGRIEGTESIIFSISDSGVVAPEPISSILFVSGGTLLTGRRLLKRRRS